MIFSSNFLPCLAYMTSILKENQINIWKNEPFRKQTYKTRAYILGPHKVETLNVPVKKPRNNCPLDEVIIDYSENWQVKNWRTIETAYKNSPYFEYYDYLIKPLFDSKIERLLDLNSLSMSICLKILKLDKTICPLEFSYFENKNQFISFNAKNREEDVINYQGVSYYQNFGSKFEKNLSIIDLIFCKGPESLSILNSSLVVSEML